MRQLIRQICSGPLGRLERCSRQGWRVVIVIRCSRSNMKCAPKKPILSIALVLTFLTLSFAQLPPPKIVRLPPSAFSELPANLIQELQRRNCTIPQHAFSNTRNNVTKGEFAKPGQM